MTDETKNNITNIPESIAKQPIDLNKDNSNEWAEKALPLVRKVFVEMKPNGVIFKNDFGKLIIVLIKDGNFDWENCLLLHMEEMTDKYDDLSEDPFEFVFIRYGETSWTTMTKKTTIPDYTFTKLYNEGKLHWVIKTDYENQYGPL